MAGGQTAGVPAGDSVILLSGGMDSAALAWWVRPPAALFIDYGQTPAAAERMAARAVADGLGIPLDELRIDLRTLGAGLLLGGGDRTQGQGGVRTDATAASRAAELSPSPEWWPLRNQLLCSLAAAWALSPRVPAGARIGSVLVASVAGDGSRHIDGTAHFYEALDAVTSMQEGGIRILAPAVGMEAEDLVRHSGIEERILAWTHSCHRSNVPCAQCPGCWKREQVLTEVGMLEHGIRARTDGRDT